MILFDKQMIGKEWEINKLTPKCRRLLSVIVRECEAFDYHVYITCVYRSDDEQRALYEKMGQPYVASTHSAYRAFDFRIFPDEKFNQELSDDINRLYPYDTTRPEKLSLLMHEGTAMHFHAQTLT